MLTIIENRRETSLLLASEIPATFDGRLRVNVANALAAAAAGLAADVHLEYIRQALRTFTTSFYQTPGRFNQMEFDGRRIVMDYCHNLAGLESMGDFVSRLEAPRAVGLISMPGDRQDGDIAAFGTMAAGIFDELVVREDVNSRGRERGEIASRLKAAATEAGMSADNVHIVLDESDAILEAVNNSVKGDLIVLMVDKPTESWEKLMSLEGSFSVA
jgi:cyanophycin synthetase